MLRNRFQLQPVGRPVSPLHQPRLRHSNYVMRRDDAAAYVAAIRDDEISTRADRRRHFLQLVCRNTIKYLYRHQIHA